MTNNNDITGFVKAPSQLVELCRNVIDQINASSEGVDVAEQEVQLRAIAKAIEQLEKSGVGVPDSLRAEKLRLTSTLSVHADAKQTLAQLADEFEGILKDIRERLGQNTTALETKPRRRRSKLPKTSPAVLREQILQALKKLGGRAKVSDIIEEMTRQLKGKLLPGDTVWRETTNESAWENNTKWERFQMTKDGILQRDSPRGIWELTEDSE